jgi:drug/metabolite transporter (DMT)-like permease
MTGRPGVAAGLGLGLCLAIGGLYRAFSLAPVRLVSPVIGAYPLLSLIIAAAQGRTVTQGDWLAVRCHRRRDRHRRADLAGGFARSSSAAPPWLAIFWALLAAVGFAGTFALGQLAARLGSDLPGHARSVDRGCICHPDRPYRRCRVAPPCPHADTSGC